MQLERLEERQLLTIELATTGVMYAPPQTHLIGSDAYLTEPTTGSPLQIGLDYVRDNAASFGLTPSDLEAQDFIISDQFVDTATGTTHIHLRQVVNGLEISQADMSINVAANGEIVSIGSTFLPLETTPIHGGVDPTISAGSAYTSFAETFEIDLDADPVIISSDLGNTQKTVITSGGLSNQNVTASLQYVPTEAGLELSWALDISLLDQAHWFDAGVSATTGQVVSLSDRVKRASYNVYPLPLGSPLEGGRSLEINPHDPIASPYGWHDVNGLPGPEFFDTRGNNVIAQEDRLGIGAATLTFPPTTRPSGGPGLNFNFPLDLTQEPVTYTDAAVTSLFYLTNVAHDLAYRYGFDEAAGNFQAFNYTGTGAANDAILAFAQSGAGAAVPTLNNAFFAPLPDGQQSFMAIFENNLDFSNPTLLATYAPRTDSDLEAETVFHEFGHGITNRLAGGSGTVGGLLNLQSQAMDEGWGDYFALAFTQRPTDQITDSYPIFEFTNGPNPANPGRGLRRFPYSFDTTVNPLTYGNFTQNPQRHAAGEIWASTLWDMNWRLIQKYGFDGDLYEGTGGNNLAIQLVMDGLKLMPANPSYLDARDAILAADLIRNQGVNHEEIWQAFARRGMGLSADDDITDALGSNSPFVSESFDLPPVVSTVRGQVFSDDDGDGVRDSNESALSGYTVFIDLNNSGNLDPLEPSTVTDGSGNYSFDFLVPGQFTIDVVNRDNLSRTFPLNGSGANVDVIIGQTATANFGLRPTSPRSTGIKFNDLNGDGRHEDCPIIPGTIQPACDREPGVAGVWIFADYDNDMRLDTGEPAVITGPTGEYSLPLDRPGTFFIREVMTPGWTQTFPGGASQAHRVTVTPDSLNVNLDFGNRTTLDYGDAPDPYPTTTSNGGPVAPILEGFHLGAVVDADLDGLPSTGADGDDNDQAVNDEDGATFSDALAPGGTGTVEVTVESGSYSPGRVNAWVDFNGDGDWSDAGEHVVVDTRLGTGSRTFSFDVPSTAAAGVSYARVTYGYHRYAKGDAPTKRDIAGEIEDYQVRVLSAQPQAVADQFRIDQNSSANTLDVLANDVSSVNGPIFIASTTVPNRGGRVSISADGLRLSYTPATGFAGVETFSYTILDQVGASSSAMVTTTVVPDTPALALDDSFDVLENSTNNVLDVLENDLAGQNPPIQIVDVLPSNNATVTVDRRGTTAPEDDVLLYTPNAGFGGTDLFSYIITDAAGFQSTASVTVHNNPSSLNDDIIDYSMVVTDLTGNPISAISVGQSFQLNVFVQDLRLDDGDGDPIDRRGIFAAYLDVLYDLSLVSVAGNIDFGEEFQNGPSGETSIPGIIDEVGAFQTGTISLGADPELLFSIPMIANAAGSAVFRGDPADLRSEVNPATPDHDSSTFQPPSNISLQGMRFSNATLAIVSSGSSPTAVDDSFSVTADTTVSNSLDVLGNDEHNGNPPLSIVSVSQGTNGGQVLIATGGSSVLYRPPAGFSGVDQFTYTAQNNTGLSASATVTVQVGDNPKTLQYRLETVPSGTVALGSEFEVRAYVQDLRASDGDANPRDDRGVFAGYIDLLFDSGLVSVLSDSTNALGFDIQFAQAYQNGVSGTVGANIVDEVGAFQSGSLPLGAGEQLLFTIGVRADATGIVEFKADPADISPLHDSLLFEPTDPVPVSTIAFGTTSVTIVGAVAEGELTNPVNNLDVNNDGHVTPIDPLVVVNYLNRTESEGEATSMYVDVTGDGHVSPIDALELINFLNNNRSMGAEGEGEGSYVSVPATGSVPSLASLTAADQTAESDPAPTIDLLVTSAGHADDAHRVDQHADAIAAWQRDDANQDDDDVVSEDLARDILGGWNN